MKFIMVLNMSMSTHHNGLGIPTNDARFFLRGTGITSCPEKKKDAPFLLSETGLPIGAADQRAKMRRVCAEGTGE